MKDFIFGPQSASLSGMQLLTPGGEEEALAEEVEEGLNAAEAANLLRIEASIIEEAKTIFKNSEVLDHIFSSGKATELEIGGRTILIEPELLFSGMTLFEENGFVLGKSSV
ncbi:MAG TPA: hypothetical protein VHA56_20635 [Mucilaginibacter sp.]|nr:hypothetical protein [Mucilaginibacter sp.]